MKKYLEIIEIRPEHINDYSRIHKEAWKDMLVAEREAGIHKEIIFLYNNLSIIYTECEDYETCDTRLRAIDVCKRWDATVKPWFQSEGVHPPMIFDLAQQLEEESKQCFKIHNQNIGLYVWEADCYLYS